MSATNEARNDHGNFEKRRLLIVDDEAAILLGFKKLMQSECLEVDTAETLEDAIRLLQTNEYQFLITDLKLGGPSGEDGFEIIKFAKERQNDTEVILITGYGTPEIMEKAFAIGVACYYEKPVSATVLKDSLKRLGL